MIVIKNQGIIGVLKFSRAAPEQFPEDTKVVVSIDRSLFMHAITVSDSGRVIMSVLCWIWYNNNELILSSLEANLCSMSRPDFTRGASGSSAWVWALKKLTLFATAALRLTDWRRDIQILTHRRAAEASDIRCNFVTSSYHPAYLSRLPDKLLTYWHFR
jgi:hypothetical protein